MSEMEKTPPHIVDARYLTDGQRLVINLSNGAMLAIPVGLIAELEGTGEAEREAITIVDGGLMLHWPEAGAHLSLLHVTMDILGGRRHVARLAKPVIDKLKARREDGEAGRPRRPRR